LAVFNYQGLFTLPARFNQYRLDDTVSDGEIIAHDVNGRPSFNVLQNRCGAGRKLHLYAFDLLILVLAAQLPVAIFSW
jgi:ATP-dependent DNA ligase